MALSRVNSGELSCVLGEPHPPLSPRLTLSQKCGRGAVLAHPAPLQWGRLLCGVNQGEKGAETNSSYFTVVEELSADPDCLVLLLAACHVGRCHNYQNIPRLAPHTDEAELVATDKQPASWESRNLCLSI